MAGHQLDQPSLELGRKLAEAVLAAYDYAGFDKVQGVSEVTTPELRDRRWFEVAKEWKLFCNESDKEFQRKASAEQKAVAKDLIPDDGSATHFPDWTSYEAGFQEVWNVEEWPKGLMSRVPTVFLFADCGSLDQSQTTWPERRGFLLRSAIREIGLKDWNLKLLAVDGSCVGFSVLPPTNEVYCHLYQSETAAFPIFLGGNWLLDTMPEAVVMHQHEYIGFGLETNDRDQPTASFRPRVTKKRGVEKMRQEFDWLSYAYELCSKDEVTFNGEKVGSDWGNRVQRQVVAWTMSARHERLKQRPLHTLMGEGSKLDSESRMNFQGQMMTLLNNSRLINGELQQLIASTSVEYYPNRDEHKGIFLAMEFVGLPMGDWPADHSRIQNWQVLVDAACSMARGQFKKTEELIKTSVIKLMDLDPALLAALKLPEMTWVNARDLTRSEMLRRTTHSWTLSQENRKQLHEAVRELKELWQSAAEVRNYPCRVMGRAVGMGSLNLTNPQAEPVLEASKPITNLIGLMLHMEKSLREATLEAGVLYIPIMSMNEEAAERGLLQQLVEFVTVTGNLSLMGEEAKVFVLEADMDLTTWVDCIAEQEPLAMGVTITRDGDVYQIVMRTNVWSSSLFAGQGRPTIKLAREQVTVSPRVEGNRFFAAWGGNWRLKQPALDVNSKMILLDVGEGASVTEDRLVMKATWLLLREYLSEAGFEGVLCV